MNAAARSSTAALSTTRHATADFLELVTRTATLDPEEKGLRRRLVLRLCAAALLLAGHVWVQMQAQALGYQSDALGRIVNRLDQERMELEMAAARESSPALLAVRARELGMQKAGLGQLRRIEAGASQVRSKDLAAAPVRREDAGATVSRAEEAGAVRPRADDAQP